jgi:hypothetical protein
MKIDESIYEQYKDKKIGETWSIRQKNGKLKYYIKGECICGKIYITRKDGKTKSCGCINAENNRKRRLGHSAYNKHTDGAKIALIAAKNVYRFYNKTDVNDLDFETFMHLAKQDCHYCGAKPSNKTHIGMRKDGTKRSLQKRKNKEGEIYYTKVWASDFDDAYFIYNGLDRIDQKKPHNIDNVVSCCRPCNFMKRDNNREEFLEHIKRIYECQILKKN